MNTLEKKGTTAQKSLVMLCLIAITFLLAMKSNLDFFTRAGSPGTDSSIFRYIGWVMTKGEVPYRDTFDHKGILLYFFNWAGTLLARIRGVWVIEVVFLLAAVVLAYAFARRYTGRWGSLFVVLLAFAQLNSYFETGNLTEEYALPFQLAALCIFSDYFSRPSCYEERTASPQSCFLHWGNCWFNVGVFLCGACFCGTFLLRANMISIWIAFCVTVLVCCVSKKKYRTLGKFILSFSLGVMLVALPALIYLLRNDAFGDFINCYFRFNSMYSKDEIRVTLATRTNSYITFLNNLPTLLSLVIISLRLKKGRHRNELFAFDCGYLAYIVLTLGLIAMSGQTYPHYGMTMCPMYVYPFSIMCEELEKADWKRTKADVLVIIYLLTIFVGPNWLPMVNNAAANISSGRNLAAKGWYDNEIVKYILKHTEADDCISVYGNNDVIYLYTERRSASKYSYQTPIGQVNPQIMDEYFADLEQAQPPIIVLATSDKRMLDFLAENNYSCVLEGKQPVYQKTGE